MLPMKQDLFISHDYKMTQFDFGSAVLNQNENINLITILQVEVTDKGYGIV